MDNRELRKFLAKKNKVLTGSYLLKNRNKNKKSLDRENYMIENMIYNKALTFHAKKNNIPAEDLVLSFVDQYKNYRKNWKQQPYEIIKEKNFDKSELFEKSRPLCLDIEVASICDLACPFCYREHIVTPDKIIDDKLCFDLIDQAAELKIPSIKFNWRGEPLLHPKIFNYIKYAKEKGIIETIINTNATNLNSQNANKLIDAGLDLIIYSFDGGTKETYEKMRPGRFKKNSFSKVYENISSFHTIRNKRKTKLPYTKIQMILTEETFKEVENFYELFDGVVDDVTVNQYTERGGNLSDLNNQEVSDYKKLLSKYKLPENTPYMRDIFGEIKISKKRKPCEQPFQRLLVTYEGKVAMCCYDWGASHPVGYTSKKAFGNQKDYENVLESVKNKKNGFELLSEVKMPIENNLPEKKIEKVKDIWFGKEINKVRSKHCFDKSEDVGICKNCTFKDVYDWSN